MVIINPMKCESCKQGLQPNNLLVGMNKEGDLIRKCNYCGNKVIVESESKKE